MNVGDIIIVNWNAGFAVTRLRTLHRGSGAERFEFGRVVIVDNCSTD